MKHKNKTILVTQHEAARELGVSVKTLRRWNCPKYAIGASPDGKCRKVRYNVEEVRTWLRQNRDVSHAFDEAEDSDDVFKDEDDFMFETGHVCFFLDSDVFKRLILDGHLNFRDIKDFTASNDVFSMLEREGFLRCVDPKTCPPDHED